MATEHRKSDVLTDSDYKCGKPWKYDQKNLVKRTIGLGGPYEGLLEGMQNALDSPIDRLKDKLRIDITIPMIDMSEYGRVIARIVDTGGSVTKDFGGRIQGYIDLIRAISPKDEHRFGIGMGQYFNVSQTVVITSMDDKYIYRIPHFLDADGLPETGDWTFDIISEETMEKYHIFAKGTMVEWFDPYGNVPVLSTVKLGTMIKKTFGWKMLEQQNTEIFINGDKLDVPEELKGKKIKFICKLKRHEVVKPNGKVIKVDPIVMGCIEGNSKGTGNLEVYADGGYYFSKEKFGHKRFGGFVSIDAMPLDTSRHVVTHEAMWLDLYEHIVQETKHFPDVPMDDAVTEKQHKSIADLINKVLKRFNIPKLQIQQLQSIKKKRIEGKGDPKGEGLIGYVKPAEKEKSEVELCDLCGHRKVKNTRGERKGCECECHIPREKGPDEHVSTVGPDGEIEVLLEEDDIITQNKRSELKIMIPDTLPKTDPFLELHLLPTAYLQINMNNPLFTRIDVIKHTDNIIPFLAPLIIELDQPNAFSEKTSAEYRKLVEDYTIQMLDDV